MSLPDPAGGDEIPIEGAPLKTLSPMNLPSLVFGAGCFQTGYNEESLLSGDIPRRTVQLALRYGINAFDTSVYYGPSEIVLGNALKALESEFPRSSYQIMTKCGRFSADDFDYSRPRIRQTVLQSLQRLHTTYLDTVYLHDVEFIAHRAMPRETGHHLAALSTEQDAYGLSPGQEGQLRGQGDQTVLDAFAELRDLQSEGLIKKIGITGYPLPTLLRIALLILHTPPYKPIDVLLSYSHFSLQNTTLLAFLPHFYERAKVKQVLAASPFSMGLLTDRAAPVWHPAPEKMLECVREARREVVKSETGMPDLAMGWAIREADGVKVGDGVRGVPLVVGFSNPAEVHECVKVWREITGGVDEKRVRKEEQTKAIFEREGYLDWSWAQPPPEFHKK